MPHQDFLIWNTAYKLIVKLDSSLNLDFHHWVKSVRIRSYSDPYLLRISLYSVEWGEIWTRITPNADTFYTVHYIPLDTGRKFKTQDVFWTFYVRFIYFLCPEWLSESLSLCWLTLQNSVLKIIGIKSHRIAQDAKLICMDYLKLIEVHAKFCNDTIGYKSMSIKFTNYSEVLNAI